MKKLYIISILLVVPLLLTNVNILRAEIPAQLLEEDHCVSCHQEMELLPEDFQDYDSHLQIGLSCSGCHGGDPTSEDPEKAMGAKAGFIGVPATKDIPQLCGRCHSNIDFMRTYQPRIPTDQVQQYFTSVHGKRLLKGDEKVAECASCHTAHAIVSAKDGRSSVYALNVPNTCKMCHSDPEYMKGYNIPTDQYEKFARSVHGKDLLENADTGAPACNDCHGNHGAAPPGVESVAHVCGNCHVNNMNYFEASSMAKPFSNLEIHACEQCHGHHDVEKTSDDMVGVGENSVCIQCHSKGDAGYQAAQEMHKSITEFVNEYNQAEAQLKDVQQKGMDDVDILYLLQEAHQTLIHIRTLVHTFNPDQINDKTSDGIKKTSEALDLEKKEIRDYHIRRRGFGIATLFITILVIALFFKIRGIESNRKKES